MTKKGVVVQHKQRYYRLRLDDLKRIVYKQKKIRPPIPQFDSYPHEVHHAHVTGNGEEMRSTITVVGGQSFQS